MNIIAGKYKGRKISFPKSEEVRPVMSLMRGAFFSIIFNDIIDARFLDVFAGTGIMSIEALSRGAKHATLVEQNKKIKETLTKNFSFVDDSYKIFFQKAENFLKDYDLDYDFIYLDPPFIYENKSRLLEIISSNSTLLKTSKIAIHYPSRENLDDKISNLEKYDSRKYGGSKLDFFSIH